MTNTFHGPSDPSSTTPTQGDTTTRATGRGFLAQAALMGVTIIVAVAAFVALGLPGLRPRALVDADPVLAASLTSGIPVAQTAVDRVDDLVAQATGQGADPVDDTLSAGGAAYATTWLKPDDPTLLALATVVEECQGVIDTATQLVDPDLTVVGAADQVDDHATPRVVGTGQIAGIPSDLTGCVDHLDTALTDVGTALEAAKTTAGDTAALAENTTARERVAAATAAAQTDLDASAGQVDDDAVRVALQTAIDATTPVVAVDTPATGWEDIDAHTATLTGAADAVDAAHQAVVDAHMAWQAAHQVVAKNTGGPSTSKGGSSSSSNSPTKGGSSNGGGSSSSNSGGSSSNGGGSSSNGGGSSSNGGGGYVSMPRTITLVDCEVTSQGGLNMWFRASGWTGDFAYTWTIKWANGSRSGSKSASAGDFGWNTPEGFVPVGSPVSCSASGNGQSIGLGGTISA